MKSYGKWASGFVKMLMIALVMLFVGYAYAGEKSKPASKPAVKAEAVDGLVLTMVSGDFTLNVDTDYTWETLVVKADLKGGTPEYKKARATCMAWDSMWSEYHKAMKDSDYAAAEKVAPYSVSKGWAAWNAASSRVGHKEEVEGRGLIYKYDEGAPASELKASIEDCKRALRWANVSKGASDLPGTKNEATGTDALEKQVKRTLDVLETMLRTAE